MKKLHWLIIVVVLGLIVVWARFGFKPKVNEESLARQKTFSHAKLIRSFPDIVTSSTKSELAEVKVDANLITHFTKATVTTNLGDLTIIFYLKAAPKTSEYFMQLAQHGGLDNMRFMRLESQNYLMSESFSLHNKQADGALTPKDFSFLDEINDHEVFIGTMAMINETNKTKGPRFIIALGPKFKQAKSRYTVFARVVGGLAILDHINTIKTDNKLKLQEDVIITDIKLLP